MLTSKELCAAAGITYRQLNYWVGQGWITYESDGKGSGYRYRYPLGSIAEAAALREASAVRRGPLVAS